MTVIMARSYSASETDRLAVIPRPLRSSIFIAGTVGPDVAESAPPSTEEKVMLSFRGTPVLAVAFALFPRWALAQHEHDHAHLAPEKLGQVHFPTSCKPEVKPAFERGLALLHSFAYAQSAAAFQEVSAKDPACGLAQRAAVVGAASARERDYIAAIGVYYQGDGVAHPTRVVAYEKAMAGVAERNPDDHEAKFFHPLSILGGASH